jgi:DnaJ-class molecular chaperone
MITLMCYRCKGTGKIERHGKEGRVYEAKCQPCHGNGLARNYRVQSTLDDVQEKLRTVCYDDGNEFNQSLDKIAEEIDRALEMLK